MSGARGLVVSLMLAAGAIAGCAAALPVATVQDASRAGVEIGDLERGRTLLAAKCSGCHRTPQPSEHRAADWPRMLDEMSRRSGLDTQQHRLVHDYLVTMAH